MSEDKDIKMQITTASHRAQLPSPRATFVHLFIISLEAALLAVQFFRMEAVTFDLLPDMADLDFGFFYGTHLIAAIWLLVVILVSYVSWEATIRLHQQGKSASGALRATVIGFWLLNAGTMIFEFVLFRMLVDDFSSLGIAGAAELFGLIMVAAHQACSFWIMKNFIRQLFFPELDTDPPAAAALSEEETSSTADADDANPRTFSSSTSY